MNIFLHYSMTRCSGICLPYCCAGSRPISDSDISDFDVDDGIGVVPPGAWMNSMVLLSFSSFLLVWIFFFLYNILEYWGYWFWRVRCGKKQFSWLFHDTCRIPGKLKDSTIHSFIFILHITLHMGPTGWFKLVNFLVCNAPSII